MRNAISKLYNAVSAPVAATRDILAERLQSVLYNRMMENMGYGQQERLKDIAENKQKKKKNQQLPKKKEKLRNNTIMMMMMMMMMMMSNMIRLEK